MKKRNLEICLAVQRRTAYHHSLKIYVLKPTEEGNESLHDEVFPGKNLNTFHHDFIALIYRSRLHNLHNNAQQIPISIRVSNANFWQNILQK